MAKELSTARVPRCFAYDSFGIIHLAMSDPISPHPLTITLAVRVRRLGTILACLLAIVVVLLLPPAWVPYGLIAGVTGLMFTARHKRLMGVSAFVLFTLILAKQLYMPWSAWIAETALATAGILGFLTTRFKLAGRWIAACLGGAWLSAGWMFYEYEFRSRSAVFNRNANREISAIVCVGDSLTAYGYPKILSTMIDMPVIDLGDDGITTVQGVRNLDKVLAAQPKVVVIELGGHDYLKGWPREEIKERLAQMIRDCQGRGAAVILFEIPCGLVTDPTRGVFREVAREHGARLIPDTAIRKLVFGSPYFPPCRWGWLPQLSDDGIHPNASGNRALATAVRYAIRELNLPENADSMGRPIPSP